VWLCPYGFFGDKLESAYYVSLLFGVLMIPLTYLLANLIYNQRVALFSALLVWLDPVQIMCSQKVWMETTLSFFIIFAIYLFIFGLQKHNENYFILSGIVSGLATLTKYPGFLAIGTIIMYSVLYERQLFRSRKFIIGLLMPMVFMFPWVVWNYKTYGINFLQIQHRLHDDSIFFHDLVATTMLAVSIILIYMVVLRASRVFRTKLTTWKPPRLILMWIRVGLLAIFIMIFWENIRRSLQIDFIPFTTWKSGVLAKEPMTFYIGRLLEYSFIYCFSFLSLFVYRERIKTESKIIVLGALVILAFYVTWGNYQSRYILAAIPFLLILGVEFLIWIFDWISQNEYIVARLFVKSLMMLAIVFILYKAHYVNTLLSFTNNYCYF